MKLKKIFKSKNLLKISKEIKKIQIRIFQMIKTKFSNLSNRLFQMN